MKYDTFYGQACTTGVKSTSHNRHILFVDNFLISKGNSCLDLATMALSENRPFTIAKIQNDAPADYVLDFSTQLRSKRSTAPIFKTLDKTSHCVVNLEALLNLPHAYGHLWRRIKARHRITAFIERLTSIGLSTHLIGTKYQQLQFSAFHRLSQHCQQKLNFVAHDSAVDEISQLLCLSSQPDTGANEAFLHRYQLSNTHQQVADPHKLLAELRPKAPHAIELRLLFRLAMSPRLRANPIIKRISKQIAPFPPCDTPPKASRQFALANATDNTKANTSRYMGFLHEYLKLDEKFNLNQAADHAAFEQWYNTSAPKHVPAKWVPKTTTQRINAKNNYNPLITNIEAYLSGDITAEKLMPEMSNALNIQPSKSGPNGLVLLLALLCDAPLGAQTLKALLKEGTLWEWFNKQVIPHAPHLFTQTSAHKPTHTQNKRIFVSGVTQASSGLSQNMKMSLQAIENMNLNSTICGTYDPSIITHAAIKNATRLKRNIMLHHVNAERVPLNIMAPHIALRDDIYHIGFPLWELTRAPSLHRLGIDMLDEIWAPSHFVAEIYRRMGAQNILWMGKGISHLPQLLKLADTAPKPRNRFTFATAFDFHSSVERKNPTAAVKAFQLAFPQKQYPDVELVVKSTTPVSDHWGDPNGQWQQIERISKHDHRIKIIAQNMSQQAYFAFLADTDCIISPHRGEGFGYLCAYALALSKPLVVTDFGGTQDYCTDKTSFPVQCELIDVPKGHAIYDTPDAKWADVSPDDMATRLHQIYTSPESAWMRAQLGQQKIKQDYTIKALTSRYKKRLKSIGAI